MFQLSTILAILFIAQPVACEPDYNILSMDGGGIKGIITVKVIAFMEEYIKNYTISKQYNVPYYYKVNDKNAHISDKYRRYPDG